MSGSIGNCETLCLFSSNMRKSKWRQHLRWQRQREKFPRASKSHPPCIYGQHIPYYSKGNPSLRFGLRIHFQELSQKSYRICLYKAIWEYAPADYKISCILGVHTMSNNGESNSSVFDRILESLEQQASSGITKVGLICHLSVWKEEAHGGSGI